MIRLSDCLNCKDTCCSNVSINVIDLAKILYSLKDYSFSEEDKKGCIYHNSKPLAYIEISEGNVGAYLSRCGFLSNNKCLLHDKSVSEDSRIGLNLKELNVSLSVKPLVCRYHPYFFDFFDNVVRVIKPCSDLSNEAKKRAGIVKDFEMFEELKRESLVCYSFNVEAYRLALKTSVKVYFDMASALISKEVSVEGDNVRIR